MEIESDPGPVSKRVLFGTVLPGLAEIFTTHKAKLATLEKRIAELEARPAVKYRGVYDGGVGDYSGGDMTTHKGQLWYCLQATKGRPGESGDWKLMHKAER